MSINSSGEHSIKYMDVYNDLKDAILNGKYLRGSFLPTETGLTEKYEVSRTTIRKAVSLLQSEGLVHVQQGRGTEVTSGKLQVKPACTQIYQNVVDVSGCFISEGTAVCMSSVVDVVAADEKVAEALEINAGTLVYRVQRLKLIGDDPYRYVVSYVPRDLAPGLESYSGQVFLLYQCLKENFGIVSTNVSETISANTAKFLESNLLDVTVGSPLLVSYRTAWCEQRVMEYTQSFLRPDIYNIVISMQGDLDYLNFTNADAF